MLGQLDSKIASMRSQSMNFSNNGIEFSLSVPDTNDVKSTLGSFVSTICEQQDTIESLRGTISQMEKENTAAQQALIAWTSQCIQELKQQNAVLTDNLNAAVQKLTNFTYNMQGYEDEDDKLRSDDPRYEIEGQVHVQDFPFAEILNSESLRCEF